MSDNYGITAETLKSIKTIRRKLHANEFAVIEIEAGHYFICANRFEETVCLKDQREFKFKVSLDELKASFRRAGYREATRLTK